MLVRVLLGLSGEQQGWLWGRYMDLLEPCDSDAEAHRRLGARWDRSPAAVAAAVERWRAKEDFVEVEGQMRAGLSSADANGLIEHYLAAVAVRAIQELAKLIETPWADAKEGRVADAKARAITMVLKAQRERDSGGKIPNIAEVADAV